MVGTGFADDIKRLVATAKRLSRKRNHIMHGYIYKFVEETQTVLFRKFNVDSSDDTYHGTPLAMTIAEVESLRDETGTMAAEMTDLELRLTQAFFGEPLNILHDGNDGGAIGPMDKIAIYEAAHAVVAFICDIGIDSISLHSDGALGETKGEAPAGLTKREEQAMVALAGRAAQIRVEPGGSEKPYSHSDWANDMTWFERHLRGRFMERCNAVPTDWELDPLRCAAWTNMNKLLDESDVWNAICATAIELVEKKTITGDEFRSLVEPFLLTAKAELAKLAHFDP